MITQEDAKRFHAAAKIIETDGCEGYFTCEQRFGKEIAGATLVTWLRSHIERMAWPEPAELIEEVNKIITDSGRMDSVPPKSSENYNAI